MKPGYVSSACCTTFMILKTNQVHLRYAYEAEAPLKPAKLLYFILTWQTQTSRTHAQNTYPSHLREPAVVTARAASTTLLQDKLVVARTFLQSGFSPCYVDCQQKKKQGSSKISRILSLHALT